MSAKKRAKSTAPDNINEEYYQISPEIIGSFPRYRPPVDLFFFREDIAVLTPLSRKGARLSNEQVEEVARLCEEGNLYVSRSDHPIYSQHIVKQLDLVLQDQNLKESEIVNICIQALQMRYGEFFSQPVKAFFEPLLRDVMVVTEYLSEDKNRINAFMRRLFCKHDPAKHAINTMIVGIWLWAQKSVEYQRRELDNIALALLMHDVGMSKMPPFLISKNGPLKNEEKEKLWQHPILSAKIMQKLDVVNNQLLQACFAHHERRDGSGYPQKLKGDQLTPIATLTALADSFAAMITRRNYAPARKPIDAANELAQDPRYDNFLARTLVAAYATNKFGTPMPADADGEGKN